MHQDDESVAFPPIKWKTEKKGKQRLLFVKGQDDKSTVANVTIAIKVMKSYYRSMPVFSAYGMPLISAYLIQVRTIIWQSNVFKHNLCTLWPSVPTLCACAHNIAFEPIKL